ncbi:protein TonB [Sphingomonas naasensis]|uniref:TonB family protein n=1 Tax=Sphingomonas naasensis TaxID=1344951 RepID=A0A4S1WEQ6_9SPHN|nr:energy transducer TonB [Sphingomonas naasensis]NIJ21635.1 protein TonB [Sphingomonas naasensis]TGX41429.1 TonB family protein [Sphingomonas naasensis]
MTFVRSTPAERGRAALGAAALTAALGYALVAGLALHGGASPGEALQLFDIGPEPPPLPRERLAPHRTPSERRAGKASPPNLRSEPIEIVAPVPVVPLPTPPPVVAAPIPGVGAAPTAGNADVPGPGTGAGGEGEGRGSGGEGDGSGDGGAETPPRWVRGELRDSDYPETAADAGVGGTVGVRYLVWTDGRVRECDITHSSGSPELDATTCRLIQQRFRFRPSRDARGRPVPAVIVENHSWVFQREPATTPARPRRRFGWP